jgi:hypothetical protein
MDGNNRPDICPRQIERDLVTEPVVKVNAVLLELSSQPVTPPEGGEAFPGKALGIYQVMLFKFPVLYPESPFRDIKEIIMIRVFVPHIADGIPAVVSQSAEIEKSPFGVKSYLHTPMD